MDADKSLMDAYKSLMDTDKALMDAYKVLMDTYKPLMDADKGLTHGHETLMYGHETLTHGHKANGTSMWTCRGGVSPPRSCNDFHPARFTEHRRRSRVSGKTFGGAGRADPAPTYPRGSAIPPASAEKN